MNFPPGQKKAGRCREVVVSGGSTVLWRQVKTGKIENGRGVI